MRRLDGPRRRRFARSEGDCVAVAKAGDTANIRRVSAAYCDKANQEAVSVVGEARKDAEECAAAKQQLVDATTPANAWPAARYRCMQ